MRHNEYRKGNGKLLFGTAMYMNGWMDFDETFIIIQCVCFFNSVLITECFIYEVPIHINGLINLLTQNSIHSLIVKTMTVYKLKY